MTYICRLSPKIEEGLNIFLETETYSASLIKLPDFIFAVLENRTIGSSLSLSHLKNVKIELKAPPLNHEDSEHL